MRAGVVGQGLGLWSSFQESQGVGEVPGHPGRWSGFDFVGMAQEGDHVVESIHVGEFSGVEQTHPGVTDVCAIDGLIVLAVSRFECMESCIVITCISIGNIEYGDTIASHVESISVPHIARWSISFQYIFAN